MYLIGNFFLYSQKRVTCADESLLYIFSLSSHIGSLFFSVIEKQSGILFWDPHVQGKTTGWILFYLNMKHQKPKWKVVKKMLIIIRNS